MVKLRPQKAVQVDNQSHVAASSRPGGANQHQAGSSAIKITLDEKVKMELESKKKTPAKKRHGEATVSAASSSSSSSSSASIPSKPASFLTPSSASAAATTTTPSASSKSSSVTETAGMKTPVSASPAPSSESKKKHKKKKKKSKDHRRSSISDLTDTSVAQEDPSPAVTPHKPPPAAHKPTETIVILDTPASTSSGKKSKKRKHKKDRRSSVSSQTIPSDVEEPAEVKPEPKKAEQKKPAVVKISLDDEKPKRKIRTLPQTADSDFDVEELSAVTPKRKGAGKRVMLSESEDDETLAARAKRMGKGKQKEQASVGERSPAKRGGKAPVPTPPSPVKTPEVKPSKNSRKRAHLSSDEEEGEARPPKKNAAAATKPEVDTPEFRSRKRLKKSHPQSAVTLDPENSAAEEEEEDLPQPKDLAPGPSSASPAVPKGKPISPPAAFAPHPAVNNTPAPKASPAGATQPKSPTDTTTLSLQEEVELLRKRVESRDLELKRLERENRRLRDALGKTGKSPEKVLQQAELLSCVICTELIAVPSTLRCGHTFCFECLHTSLQTKRTCPSCRELVTSPPSESLLITQHINEYIEKLGDENEREAEKKRITLKLHQYRQAKQGKNLWGDISKPRPVHDIEENVFRCHSCAWELEGATCDNCQTVHSLTDGIYPFQHNQGGGGFNDDDEEMEEMGAEDLNYSDDENSIDYAEEDEDDDSFVVDDDMIEYEDSADERGGFDQGSDEEADDDDEGADFRDAEASEGEEEEDGEEEDGQGEEMEGEEDGQFEEEEDPEYENDEDEDEDDEENEDDDDDDDDEEEDEEEEVVDRRRHKTSRAAANTQGRSHRSRRQPVSGSSSEDESGGGGLLQDLLDD